MPINAQLIRLTIVNILLFIGIVYCLFTSIAVKAEPIPVIAAAASSKFALRQLSKKFTENCGLRVKLSFSSSGNLMRQIIQGGPYQLFISADESYVDKLYGLGLTVDSGIVYAKGRVVFFTANNSPINTDVHLADLKEGLKDGRLKRFAIANPEHAPYGRVARDVLKSVGIWEAIKPKLILGENVSQAAQFAGSGLTQGGIFSYSLILSPAVKSLGKYVLLPESMHQPFNAKMVMLKTAGKTAHAFYRYLQQPEARVIFDQYGFLLPD